MERYSLNHGLIKTVWFRIYTLGVLVAARRLAVSFLLGAAYGLLALEIASPFAIPLILFVVLLAALAWRLHYQPLRLASVAAAFVVGFTLVFSTVVIRLAIKCQPPSCTWAGASTTLAEGGLILLPTLVLVAGAAMLGRLMARSTAARRP